MDDILSELVFVGTGVSTALPVLTHCFDKESTCTTCAGALDPASKNRRNNVSLLIRHNGKDVLVDCGKTFRDAALRVLLPLGVREIAALLLTHGHMDAMAGLDDVRDLQKFEANEATGTWKAIRKMPTYLDSGCFDVVKQTYPYIVEASEATEPWPRKVTQLNFHIVGSDPDAEPVPFTVEGLEVTPLPVFHGGDYICLGFSFGRTDRVVYLSDISGISETILGKVLADPVHILVVDCLHPSGRTHFSHFCFDQAVAFVAKVNPRHAYMVGMFCDLEHDATNARLAEWLNSSDAPSRLQSVELAWDGMVVQANLH